MNLRRIHHVAYRCRDAKETVDFYRDLLGMREIERPDFGFPGHWFQAGATQVHLILNQEGCSSPGCHLDPDAVSEELGPAARELAGLLAAG